MKTHFNLGLIWFSTSLSLLHGAETGNDKPMTADMKKPMAEAMDSDKKPMMEKSMSDKPMTETADTSMKKKSEEKTDDTTAKEKEDNTVTITPFRTPRLPTAKETRTFQVAKLNKPLAYETSIELKKLFGTFITQNLWDTDSKKYTKTPGCIALINYTVLQDLGDNRYVVKGSWAGVGSNEVLPAGNDSWAVLLLDHAATLGDSAKVFGVNVGTVALSFTAKFPPIKDKKITLRREAFLQCKPLEDTPMALQQFVDAINQGAELSVVTTEKVTCKTCGGLGFTHEAQKGKLEDKRVPCTDCENGKTTKAIETKFVP
jgi:hypothetical protein